MSEYSKLQNRSPQVSFYKETKVQSLLHGHTIEYETSPLMNSSEILQWKLRQETSHYHMVAWWVLPPMRPDLSSQCKNSEVKEILLKYENIKAKLVYS